MSSLPNSTLTPPAGSASWQEKEAKPRPTRAKKSASAGSPASSKEAAPPLYSVFQARLNWVTLHSPAWMEGKVQASCRWGRLSGREAGAIYQKLNHDYLTLETALETWPNDDMQGATWLELRVRLQRWKGMLAGLWDVIERNSRKGWVPPTPSGEPDT